ncbi:MAG: hypothetical protein CFK52_12810 [Chloracidobacterium sp. CP2_5A]|nr:MAG: hypothetical protein CFK52_12810 [Chloracidobacterium sp. CP2_5A]
MNRFGRYSLAWLGWRGTVARSGYLRLPEWLGLVAFFLGLVSAIASYEALVSPLSQRIGDISRETSDIRRQTEAARIERQRIEREAAAFAGAMENWRRFERERLRDARIGQLALIDEINALARRHEVKLTDTVSFAMTGQDKAAPGGSSSGKRDVQSYPALDVRFGISGPYQNIRRFMQSLEQSRQFLLLQLMSLTPGEIEAKPGGGVGPAAERPATASGETAVTLALTAYFRNDPPATASGDASPARAPRRVAAQTVGVGRQP